MVSCLKKKTKDKFTLIQSLSNGEKILQMHLETRTRTRKHGGHGRNVKDQMEENY